MHVQISPPFHYSKRQDKRITDLLVVNLLQGTVIALIAVREFSKFAKNKLQPVTFESILREPYGVKPLRKMIDSCAFRIYGHWVKRNKDENQNRAALFENKPHKERYNGNGHLPRKSGNLESYNASFRMSSLGQIQYKSVRKIASSN